jgi:hypothetical protein
MERILSLTSVKVEDGDYMLIVSANQQEHGGIAGEGEARHRALNVG